VAACPQNDIAGTMHPVPGAKPAAPEQADHVADVRHRLVAVLRRLRHAPTGEDQLAAHQRCCARSAELVGEDGRQSGRLPVETIVEIHALRNEITHMHMIDAAIATERDETWLN
jgi:hypothetical protein